MRGTMNALAKIYIDWEIIGFSVRLKGSARKEKESVVKNHQSLQDVHNILWKIKYTSHHQHFYYFL